MKLTSILAIYSLFFVMSMFLVLPFGVRTDEELGVERQPGHAESAPHSFSLPRTLLRAALLATPLFALFYANWLYGWLTANMLDWAR